MTVKTTAIFIILISFLSISVKAQKWNVENYSIGYRVFEISAVGNNPTTIAPLLKEPASYQRYLNTIQYNSLSGNPAILTLHTFYINAEWNKEASLLRFWKKCSLQTGLLLTIPIKQDAGAIGYQSTYVSADTNRYRNLYALTKQQQFLGANVGVNRRFTLSKKLKFLIGLHVQGSIAFVHHYKQRWDSSTYTPQSGWKSRTTEMPRLKGKNFIQWQVMVPLGLEFEVYQNRFFIRMEAGAGIVESNYRPKGFPDKEAHGAGMWFIYRPRTRK